MDYDFSNGPNCIESIKNFRGLVSGDINYIDEYLEKIITKRGGKPERCVGDKIKQFKGLYPNSEELISDMRYLNKIRNALIHGKTKRDAQNLDLLYCIYNKGKRIEITKNLVDEFQKTYTRVYDTLIELNR